MKFWKTLFSSKSFSNGDVDDAGDDDGDDIDAGDGDSDDDENGEGNDGERGAIRVVLRRKHGFA